MTDAAGPGSGQSLEAIWKASERLYKARRDAELREYWYAYHLDQADRLERLFARLVAEHRRKAKALEASVPQSAILGNGRPSVSVTAPSEPSVRQGEDKQVSDTIGETPAKTMIIGEDHR